MIVRVFGLTIALFTTFSVNAEIVHFECELVDPEKGSKWTEAMSIDMTEKVWETPEHTFSEIVISPSAVRANDIYQKYSLTNNVALFLSREDLSYSQSWKLGSTNVSDKFTFNGTCKLVEAPKVERAF